MRPDGSSDARRTPWIDPAWIEAATVVGAGLMATDPSEARVLLSHACADPAAGWDTWHELGLACLRDGAPNAARAALEVAERRRAAIGLVRPRRGYRPRDGVDGLPLGSVPLRDGLI